MTITTYIFSTLMCLIVLGCISFAITLNRIERSTRSVADAEDHMRTGVSFIVLLLVAISIACTGYALQTLYRMSEVP